MSFAEKFELLKELFPEIPHTNLLKILQRAETELKYRRVINRPENYTPTTQETIGYVVDILLKTPKKYYLPPKKETNNIKQNKNEKSPSETTKNYEEKAKNFRKEAQKATEEKNKNLSKFVKETQKKQNISEYYIEKYDDKTEEEKKLNNLARDYYIKSNELKLEPVNKNSNNKLTIDLHNLYKKEAIKYLKGVIGNNKNIKSLIIITGSSNRGCVLRPAVIKYASENKISYIIHDDKIEYTL